MDNIQIKNKYLKYKIKYHDLKNLMEGGNIKLQEEFMKRWLKFRKSDFIKILKTASKDEIISIEGFIEYCNDIFEEKSKELDNLEKEIKSIDDNITQVLEDIKIEKKKYVTTGKLLTDLKRKKKKLNAQKQKHDELYQELYPKIEEYKSNLKIILDNINENVDMHYIWYGSFKFVLEKMVYANKDIKDPWKYYKTLNDYYFFSFTRLYLNKTGYKQYMHNRDETMTKDEIEKLFSGDPIQEKELVDKYKMLPITK